MRNNKQHDYCILFKNQNRSQNLGQTTRPYNNHQKEKRTCKIVDFVVPADQRVKSKESERKDKYFDLTRDLKKPRNIKVVFLVIVICALGSVTKGLIKRMEDFEISGDHPNYCITEIGQNTEKSCGNLWRLAVTQTPLKDHQLTLI